MESEKWNLGLQAAIARKEAEESINTELIRAGQEERTVEETESETVEDSELYTGYNGKNKTWELIIKYQGNLGEILADFPRVSYEELIAGYGILVVAEDELMEVSAIPQIEYLEKPKRFYANERNAQEICTDPIKNREPYLSGEGVLIAILDSGITPDLKEFQNEDQTTRIVRYWDQATGRIYTADEINQLLQSQESFPVIDITGHGTAVSSIAAGTTLGIANRAELLVVKLGSQSEAGFGKTTDIMRGVTFALKYAIAENKPLVINLSYGTVFGSHRGDSLLERFLDNASEIWKTVICVGTGNEGDANGHIGINLMPNDTREIEFAIGKQVRNLVLETFLGFMDEVSFWLVSPGGELNFLQQNGVTQISQPGYEIFCYAMEGTPYAGQREIYLEFSAKNEPPETDREQQFPFTYVEPGLWKIRVETKRIVDGRMDIYMTGTEGRGSMTGFLTPDPNGTITIPATAGKVLSIGATDQSGNVYAPFSGRGFVQASFGTFHNKPELVAAGIGIPAINRLGEQLLVTGTSFSTPIVSGMAALLMEWGIVKGNDPYMYGQKCKARLIRGARKVIGVGNMSYPNPLVGWGTACGLL